MNTKNENPEIIKYVEENIGSILFDILDNIFEYVSLGKGNKSKNKQMELQWNKKLLHSEGNYQWNEKVTHWMRDVCKQHSNKGLIFKRNIELIQLITK